MPLVDVVIPAYNAEPFIDKALQSVVEQGVSVRIIVVDDGSTDSTDAAIERFSASNPGVEILYRKQHNAGPAAARNHGLRLAESEFVALLDADDIWLPGKLKRQLEVFEQTPANVSLGVVYCDYGLIGPGGENLPNLGFRLDLRIRGQIYEPLLHANLIAGSASAVLIRRTCLERVGLFDESLVCAEDWDLWLRLARHYSYDYVAATLVALRQHPTNSQKNESRMLGGELLFLDKLYRSGQMRWFHMWRLRRRLFLGKVDATQLKGFDRCHARIQAAVSGWRMLAGVAVIWTALRVRGLSCRIRTGISLVGWISRSVFRRLRGTPR